jgi:benzaldehyde dehydrogenase (NAD)
MSTLTAERLMDDGAWAGKLYSGGWSDGGGGPLPVVDKATGESLTEVAIASADDVSRAVAIAAEAQRAWQATYAVEQRSVFIKAAQLLEENRAEIAEWIVRETGGIQGKAQFEIKMSLDELLEAAAMPTQPTGMIVPGNQPGVTSIARRIPRGVVGVISPWNFPLILGLRSVAPALALGNAVILKPDPQTPIVGGFLLALLFAEAGLPDGLFHVLPGGAETGEAIVKHPGIRTISFTGSTAIGRHVNEVAAPLMKKVALELGGNNAYIVLDDADLEVATSSGAWGSFLHQGQICMTAGRHIVHERIAEKYVALLAERAARLPVGNPSEGDVALGPMINQKQIDRVHQIVDDSVAAGARLVTGGTSEGPYFQPTVLADVTPSMAAFTEEIFGPVAPVTVVSSDEEAVAVANMTPWGLVAAVQGSVERARRVGEQLQTGLVHINDQTVNYESYIPFGGCGDSGNGGRFGGAASLDEFTEWQWMTLRDVATAYPF